jgi:acetyl esterase/lipase
MRTLDIYLPETGEGPFPTIIFLHGGAFVGGHKRDLQAMGTMEAITDGFAVVSVDQRMLTMTMTGKTDEGGLFPYPLFDYKAAIRFLRKNADTYKLDPDRFATWGDSAGGYHAVMAAMTADVPAMYDPTLGYSEVSGRVQAVVDWFGVGDLALQSAFTDSQPPMKLPDGTEMPSFDFASMFLGVKATEHTNLAYLANPEIWVTPDAPPVLIQVGGDDAVVPIGCSLNLAKRIEEVCGKDRVTLDVFEGGAHGDPRMNEPDNLARVFTWLKEKLK